MPEKKMRKTTRLKNLYNRTDRILICISAPSPYGAKLIEAAGFEYTYAAGGVTGSSMRSEHHAHCSGVPWPRARDAMVSSWAASASRPNKKGRARA